VLLQHSWAPLGSSKTESWPRHPRSCNARSGWCALWIRCCTFSMMQSFCSASSKAQQAGRCQALACCRNTLLLRSRCRQQPSWAPCIRTRLQKMPRRCSRRRRPRSSPPGGLQVRFLLLESPLHSKSQQSASEQLLPCTQVGQRVLCGGRRRRISEGRSSARKHRRQRRQGCR
jgi:hypothetical protein